MFHGESKYTRPSKVTMIEYKNISNMRGVEVWDMLPVSVQNATTLVEFKTLVKAICRTT